MITRVTLVSYRGKMPYVRVEEPTGEAYKLASRIVGGLGVENELRVYDSSYDGSRVVKKPKRYNLVIHEARKLKTGTKHITHVAPFLYTYIHDKVAEIIMGHGGRVEVSPPSLSRVFRVGESRVELRPYQEEALESWMNAGMRGTIVLPTGSGKTIVAIEAIRRLGVRTLVLVPTGELVEQWRESLRRHGVEAGRLYVRVKELGADVLVSTYKSAFYQSREGKLDLGRYAFLVLDEAHHVPAHTLAYVAWTSLAPYRMALTATPERPDGNTHVIYTLAGGIVYARTYGELARGGYLPPVRIQMYLVPSPRQGDYGKLVEEYRRARERLDEIVVTYMERHGVEEGEARRRLQSASWEYRELSSRLRQLASRIHRLEAENPVKEEAAVKLVSSMAGEGRKVFVFTRYVEQANRLYEELRRTGVRAGLVTGDTSPGARQYTFRRFRDGLLNVIVTTTVLDEGVDAPAADTAVILSSQSISSPRQFLQRIGRVLRPGEGKTGLVVLLASRGLREERGMARLKGVLEEYYGRDSIDVWGTILLVQGRRGG